MSMRFPDDGTPGTHVPECRVGTVRAFVVLAEPLDTLFSSSFMK